MNTPIWNNPIWYRGYRIYFSSVVFANFAFVHDDYEPVGGRAGYGKSIEDCKSQIDEIEDDE